MNKGTLAAIEAPARLGFWLCALLSLMLPITLTELMLYFQQQQYQELQQQLTTEVLRELGTSLEYELATTLQPGNGLANYVVANQGNLDPSVMEPWLVPIIREERHLRNVAVAPGNTVTYVYPLAGNESVPGLYYPRNKDQWPEIERIILGRKPMLTGPLPLTQGGQGLIYRVPVYLDQHYWGIVSAVINADTLFEQLQVRAEQSKLRVALIEGRDNPRYWRHLWGDVELLVNPPLKLELNVPGRNWQLLAATKTAQPPTLWILRACGWLSGLILMLLVLRLRKS